MNSQHAAAQTEITFTLNSSVEQHITKFKSFKKLTLHNSRNISVLHSIVYKYILAIVALKI